MDKNKNLEDDLKNRFNDTNDDTDEGDSFSIIIEDDDMCDIVIEISEEEISELVDDLVDDVVDDVVDELIDDIVLSKHKIEGKHTLKYDSIFKGKKDISVDENEPDLISTHKKETIEVDKGSLYYNESIDSETYVRGKLVKERVYEVLKDNTSLNFLNNRRKPSRVDFNSYYELLKINLKSESFTNIELFNELSVYFSDNIFNMFKLLDNKWRNDIIQELQEHIGKNVNSKEVTNRNIYEGTEIEFLWFDMSDKTEKLITGVVLETDYTNSTYRVDSYENIYQVDLLKITKILNNTKFKYNLNKLNNIDFL